MTVNFSGSAQARRSRRRPDRGLRHRRPSAAASGDSRRCPVTNSPRPARHTRANRGVGFAPEGGPRRPRRISAPPGPGDRDLRADRVRQERGCRGDLRPHSGGRRVGGRDAGVPRRSDPHESAAAPDKLVGIWHARQRGLGRSVRAARPRGGRRDARRRPDTYRGRAEPGSTFGPRSSSCRFRRRRRPVRASTGSASTTASARRACPRAPRRSVIPGCGRGRPPERPAAGRTRARARRCREVAATRTRPALVERLPPSDPDRRASTCPREVLAARISGQNARDGRTGCRARGRDRPSPVRCRAGAAGIIGLRELADSAARRGRRCDRPSHAAVRRLPAQVDATDPRHRYR